MGDWRSGWRRDLDASWLRAQRLHGAVNSVNQIAPYTYPMTILEPQDLASGLAFMGLAGALGSTIAGGICAALMNSAGGLPLVFKVPVVCAAVMLACALLFQDRKNV